MVIQRTTTNEERLFRVNAAATVLGVSPSTLRNYERGGIIPPAGRNRAGQRIYTCDDLAVIRAAILAPVR